jgi:hypothetical protein
LAIPHLYAFVFIDVFWVIALGETEPCPAAREFRGVQLIRGIIAPASLKRYVAASAALGPYLTRHLNRLGRYDLDMDKPPPELIYDLWK